MSYAAASLLNINEVEAYNLWNWIWLSNSKRSLGKIRCDEDFKS